MSPQPPIRLRSGLRIGPGEPCFVVAEIGNNHQGDYDLAEQMVEEAARMGVQAVKFQKRHVESLFTRQGLDAPYTGKNSFGSTYGEHRRALELTVEEMARLKDLAESLGLVFFASAWDAVSLDELLDLDVELLKLCSADLVNVPLLQQVGRTGLPVIMSTGMSTIQEIDLAVDELRRFHDRLVLLQCNSSYPCRDAHVGLPVMEQFRRRYKLPVGYSGHEAGLGPSVGAIALGACVVERHFTLDKTLRGTDHMASLEPDEFACLVRMIREVEQAMQIREKILFPEEEACAAKLRKSIVFTRDLPKGHELTEADLTVKCPGTGISPFHWNSVMGAVLTRGVHAEEQLAWEHLVCGWNELPLSQPQTRRAGKVGSKA